jgi:hypothetical protein
MTLSEKCEKDRQFEPHFQDFLFGTYRHPRWKSQEILLDRSDRCVP